MDKQLYECVDCGWIGTDEEKLVLPDGSGMDVHSCPNCFNDSFYYAKDGALPSSLDSRKTVGVSVDFVCRLASKQDWVNKIPAVLPDKDAAETWLFIDQQGNQLTTGQDFQAAEELGTYPVDVYKPTRVSSRI